MSQLLSSHAEVSSTIEVVQKMAPRGALLHGQGRCGSSPKILGV